MRRFLVLPLLVFGIFMLAVGSAWAWFHVNPRKFPTYLRFEVLRAVPGYAFTNEVLGAEAMDLLAVSTNDLINGVFVHPGVSRMALPERVSVFYAGWSARSAKEMSVVQHTPDVCWVGAGAKPVALGQPSLVELRWGEGTALFECRIFELFNGRREMSLWCTLVSGQAYGEAGRFAPAKNSVPSRDLDSAMMAAGRRVAGNQFLNSVRERVPGTGEKQFVRFSTTIEGQDWRGALERLKQFGVAWLALKVTHNPSTAAPEPTPRN